MRNLGTDRGRPLDRGGWPAVEDFMMPDTPSPAVQEAVSVGLHDIERELSRQMRALQGAGEAPVLRARMSNLVVFCDRPDMADRVAAQIPDIVAIHPARVLLLVGEPREIERSL